MLDREKVGRAISEQRKAKGMTQKQLADLLNVSYQAVSRWEQGISLPSVDMIYDMARTLETTVDYLLNGLSGERRIISYTDAGLDAKRLYMTKDRLSRLVTGADMLFYAKFADPVFFRPEIEGMEEPLWVFANHVPGSKERFAMENGYDREICKDLVANVSNNLIRFGVRPLILQAIMVCGDNDSSQILLMGEAFKEACEESGIVFAGLEVSAQPVNYREGEYRLDALAMGAVDRKQIITGEGVAEGDVLIGLHTEGISSLSYPFIKVILDRRPDILHASVKDSRIFMDEVMKPNSCYVNVIRELREQKLVHGVFGIQKSVFNRKAYKTIPKGLGAAISVSGLPFPPLFQYIFDLNLMDRECFLEDFSPGIGMVLAVSEKLRDRAVKVIEKHCECSVLGEIRRDDGHSDAKVWMEE